MPGIEQQADPTGNPVVTVGYKTMLHCANKLHVTQCFILRCLCLI